MKEFTSKLFETYCTEAIQLINSTDYDDMVKLLGYMDDIYSLDVYDNCSNRDIVVNLINLLCKANYFTMINSIEALDIDVGLFLFNTYKYDISYMDFSLTKKIISNGISINHREALGLVRDYNTSRKDLRDGGYNLYYFTVRLLIGNPPSLYGNVIDSSIDTDVVYEFLEWLIGNKIGGRDGI